jgi:hypothetical protein
LQSKEATSHPRFFSFVVFTFFSMVDSKQNSEKVIESACPSLIGISGIVAQEKTNVLILITKNDVQKGISFLSLLAVELVPPTFVTHH